jgi:hypothetical protein
MVPRLWRISCRFSTLSASVDSGAAFDVMLQGQTMQGHCYNLDELSLDVYLHSRKGIVFMFK